MRSHSDSGNHLLINCTLEVEDRFNSQSVRLGLLHFAVHQRGILEVLGDVRARAQDTAYITYQMFSRIQSNR